MTHTAQTIGPYLTRPMSNWTASVLIKMQTCCVVELKLAPTVNANRKRKK